MKRLKPWHKAAGIGLVAACIFYLTTKPVMAHFDYTHRLAVALLNGRLGVKEHPAWLNELVLVDSGRYYTGNYCLGAILSVIPFLFISPHQLTAVIAGTCVFSFFMLGGVEEMKLLRRTMLALFPVFGTWTWTNLGSGGAWDLSQGFGMIGQAGALYFTLVQSQPFVAGSFFALAFGNRAELILTLPIYLFLMKQDWKRNWLRFLIVPGLLALLTGVYNFARFHSPLEFGYHRQNLMNEHWCQHGLFSIYPVPYNLYHLLFEGLIDIPTFPFMRPSPWGCSIFLASPFLFLLFREGAKHKIAAWTAIGLLIVVVLCHCSQGGWMFSSRYSMILLPWMFLLLAGNGRLSATEIALFAVSVAINGTAAWLFLWTGKIQV